MGRCVNHETALDCIRAKARLTKDELNELKAWKTVQENKLAISKDTRGELEKQTELLKQVLEDKGKEISDTKKQLCQEREEAVREYCDSDTLLLELKGSFAEGFDNALHQVKASYLDLDVSHVTIDAQAQTSIQPVHSESTDELFADDAIVDDPHGDGGTTVESKAKTVEDSTRQLEDQVLAERDNDALVQQQLLFIYLFF